MLLTLKQASQWASKHMNKNVTPANITYLIQYGRIESVVDNGVTLIEKKSLENYYSLNRRKTRWKDELGDDLNWTLSFEKVKEAETTKHVHRLHPYKGKFIPQLVGYFLDAHTDDFKRDVYFQPGDIVLDPFCGSGTTLVQANELGMHAIGIDISAFNAFIGNAKVTTYNLTRLYEESQNITRTLRNFVTTSGITEFETKLAEKLTEFNNQYFPISFKRQVRAGEINQKQYGTEKEVAFLKTYHELVSEYQIDVQMPIDSARFMKRWYLPGVRAEIEFIYNLIKKVEDLSIQNALMLILSRTIRSCRATTHADLGTLRKPVTTTYYCRKHGKVCKPLFSILSWWERYCKDSVQRWVEFGKLKTDTFQHCITGDSQTIDIFTILKHIDLRFAEIAQKQRIKGIFTSPPYVGLINYHEQHAYAYDLFDFKRLDELEIGPLFRGKGREARESYIHGVAEVFKNCKRFLTDDYDVFTVANDKFNMYPTIAEIAGMHIVNQHKRPVLNRTEKNRGSAYSETIFHLKEKRN
ncbi:site-specific DNA-methyltransferase [Candidatus Poribacteria bacterium]|nr:site-specific DNA-methyltransferase [Candidatus Poribacteria bacterium]